MRFFLLILTVLAFDARAYNSGCPNLYFQSDNLGQNFVNHASGRRHIWPSQLTPPASTNIRPCSPITDACIRSYFSRKVGCSPKPGITKNRLNVGYNLFIPSMNMTVVQKPILVTQLDSGVVQDFFYNRVADRLVMVVKFKNVYFNGTTTFKYRPQGVLPLTVPSTTYELYPELFLTTTFGSVDNPHLNNINAIVNVTQELQYNDGIDALSITDPVLIEFFKIFTENIDQVVRDCFLTRAVLMSNYFIQAKYCNYNVPYNYINWDALNRV